MPLTAGFTGTRSGTTVEQYLLLENIVSALQPALALHGDCQGADEEFDDILLEHDVSTIIHPPSDPRYRAFCDGEHIFCVMEPEDFLARDKKIANAADVLIAAPQQFNEVRRSGTWATIRYAHKAGKTVLLALPDGGGGVWYPRDAEILYLETEQLLDLAEALRKAAN